jgi:hypothetical protein
MDIHAEIDDTLSVFNHLEEMACSGNKRSRDARYYFEVFARLTALARFLM